MYERPIIKEITSQKCVGYRTRAYDNALISIIENEGVDLDGMAWRWRSETVSTMNSDGVYMSSFGNEYGYMKLGVAK